jgi:hypothetical protein
MGQVETIGWVGVKMRTYGITTVVVEGVEGIPLTIDVK